MSRQDRNRRQGEEPSDHEFALAMIRLFIEKQKHPHQYQTKLTREEVFITVFGILFKHHKQLLEEYRTLTRCIGSAVRFDEETRLYDSIQTVVKRLRKQTEIFAESDDIFKYVRTREEMRGSMNVVSFQPPTTVKRP